MSTPEIDRQIQQDIDAGIFKPDFERGMKRYADKYREAEIARRKLESERDAMLRVLRHCRLFIVDRKGYLPDEETERKWITQQIDMVIPQNADALPQGNP
jgi:hypothetical protein